MLIAVLENPNYIINIGGVIRNVNAFGADALYVVDPSRKLEDDLDLIRQRKTLLKHSSGALRYTTVKRFDTAAQCLDELGRAGFVSVATSPHTIGKKSSLLHQSKLDMPKLAIWFGDEASGLSTEVIERVESCLMVEMRGKVESLNLATTTGIVLYEAVRQRQKMLH